MTAHPLALAVATLSPSPVVAARQLAEAGVPVFACVPGGKRPLPGSRGFLDATTDRAQIGAWWRRVPDANLAIPTGRVSGVVVVDVDVHGANGFDAFHTARAAGLLPRPLVVVRTPSGGMHLCYPARQSVGQRSWQAAKAGIDFRGDGGYIIAPPSRVRVDGVLRAYEVVELHADATTPVDAARLRDFLDPRPPERTRALRPVWSRGGGVERIASWVHVDGGRAEQGPVLGRLSSRRAGARPCGRAGRAALPGGGGRLVGAGGRHDGAVRLSHHPASAYSPGFDVWPFRTP
ncbi:bifunctional DNA primase/polymerase [Propionibacterium freudenreichii]|uniref:bifunctional DNA primase/polymerase n=1 Tax=Propionibacterium freudenreichii TaxID=1744 RepID=UPI0021A6D582|nr:bifunctional DNA primase/polymerase [Propionibacterium freudenreichii]